MDKLKIKDEEHFDSIIRDFLNNKYKKEVPQYDRRDPKRIEELLKALYNVWNNNTDLRFFQLIAIIESKLKEKKETNDLFYTEDDITINFLKELKKEKL